MTTNKGSKHKHLTFDDRIKIQEMLGSGENFKSIALELNKDPGTVSKESRKHLLIRERTYTLKDEYGNQHNEICDKLTKAIVARKSAIAIWRNISTKQNVLIMNTKNFFHKPVKESLSLKNRFMKWMPSSQKVSKEGSTYTI